MIYRIFLLSIIIITLFGCRKDGKDCWQGWNVTGAEDAAGVLVCEKTKAQAEAEFPGFWFYRQGETKYCYRSDNSGNVYYWANIPESIKDQYVTTGQGPFTRIDCSSFCNCVWLEKQKSKITGNFQPSRVIKETLVNSDTCSKLFIGRIITIRETSDSIITRELTGKKP